MLFELLNDDARCLRRGTYFVLSSNLRQYFEFTVRMRLGLCGPFSGGVLCGELDIPLGDVLGAVWG